MSSYRQIAGAFTRVGLNQNSLVTQVQLLTALDQLGSGFGIQTYDRNVAQQLWNQTQKQNRNQVYVRDFIATIMKGEQLVKRSITQLQGQIQYQNDPNLKAQYVKDLVSYTEDLKFLTLPFGVAGPRHSKILEQSGFVNQDHLVNNRSRISNSTVIFAREIPQNSSGSSTDLKVAFLITAILTFVELIIMFQKHHFYSLLVYISVFAIFFLGYFDLHYLRFVKINLLISTILDLTWLVVNFGEYWSPRAQTQHSSLQWGFLKFILFFLLGIMVGKILVAAILFKYRNNPNNMKRNVSLFGVKYLLSGAPRSPIAKIVNGTQNFTNGFMNNPSGVSQYENSY